MPVDRPWIFAATTRSSDRAAALPVAADSRHAHPLRPTAQRPRRTKTQTPQLPRAQRCAARTIDLRTLPQRDRRSSPSTPLTGLKVLPRHGSGDLRHHSPRWKSSARNFPLRRQKTRWPMNPRRPCCKRETTRSSFRSFRISPAEESPRPTRNCSPWAISRLRQQQTAPAARRREWLQQPAFQRLFHRYEARGDGGLREELLLHDGWQRSTKLYAIKSESSDVVRDEYRKQGNSLRVRVRSAASDEKKPRSSVEYLIGAIGHQLPAPPDAADVELDDTLCQMQCAVPRSSSPSPNTTATP